MPECFASTCDETFSIDYSKIDFTHFVFASGDEKVWMMCDKSSVGGVFNREYYTDAPRQISKSSDGSKVCSNPDHARPYTAKWYNRSGCKEDPMISLEDHEKSCDSGKIIYMENSWKTGIF